MAWVDTLLESAVSQGASDLHLSSGQEPRLRIDGIIQATDGSESVSSEQMMLHLKEIAPEDNWEQYQSTGDSDFAYHLEGCGRFRVNIFMDLSGPGAVLRQIPEIIPSAESLGLPLSILDFCEHTKGLVLVTGPTGSGKSTTLAAMIDHINRTKQLHVITIEDPVEFVHSNNRCLINQREIGKHTDSFKKALRAALREDPDVVLVGEMRDLETVAIAIETAETGHLVFGTLHTSTAPSTVDRIIDQFPAGEQQQIRMMLSGSLRGVISQTLCRKKESGRVAAHEILVANTAVSALIREGKSHQIESVMQVGGKQGMRLLNDTLEQLVVEGTIHAAEAMRCSTRKEDMKNRLDRNSIEIKPTPPPSGTAPGRAGTELKHSGEPEKADSRDTDPPEHPDSFEEYRKRRKSA